MDTKQEMIKEAMEVYKKAFTKYIDETTGNEDCNLMVKVFVCVKIVNTNDPFEDLFHCKWLNN